MANESLSTWRQISWCLNKSIVYFSGAPTLASRSVSHAGNLLHHSSYWGWLSTSPGYGQEGRAHPVTFLQMSSVLLGKFLTILLMFSPVPFLLLPNFSLKSSSRALWPKSDPKGWPLPSSTVPPLVSCSALFLSLPDGNSSQRLVTLSHDPALLTAEGCCRS